ncbi:Thiol:disulfide interchange protein DsbC [Mariprofundus ferrinatatus]|uniref:Thiol:disulfide interchange protein n=1 Tax=Mariprofundus ferrinatatus TaxID=1921087 RepID=A0A2K8L6Q2_9PROT|nr:DsbC family protein [Mariprofundus ferrinatatus]ATX81521.1 Thiol:disulfide interchange protein DsbC [Mariprofundus ferrinatatus]
MKKAIMVMITMIYSGLAMADGPGVDNSTADAIRQALSRSTVININTTPIEGVYELQIGNSIVYSDATGRYLIDGGSLLDIQEQKNLTQSRLEYINRVDWDSLPLDKAIVSGDKKAKQKIAVFTDPDCPYCRHLEKTLQELKGVKVYTFLYPIESLHPKAREKSEAIWCSRDRHKMLQKVMLENHTPDAATCKTPVEEIAALGQKLNINGTPAIIATDGRRMNGAPRSVKQLEEWLASH